MDVSLGVPRPCHSVFLFSASSFVGRAGRFMSTKPTKVAHVIRRDRREAVLAVGDKNILLHHGDMTARGSGALIACRVDMSAELAESRIRSDKTSSCNVPWRLCEDGNP